MKSAIIVVSALVSSLVLGADCPTPKPLTCEQLEAKMAQRCPTKATPVCGECKPTYIPVAGPERIVEKTKTVYQDVPVPAEPKGRVLVGGGPIYDGGDLGVTAVAGYQFKNGLQILAGPTYINREATHGVASGCKRRGGGNGGHDVCLDIPYTVEPPSNIGGQLLVVFGF